jgi:glycogen operon protein
VAPGVVGGCHGRDSATQVQVAPACLPGDSSIFAVRGEHRTNESAAAILPGDLAMPTTVTVPQRTTDVRQTTPLAPFQAEPGRPHPLGATVKAEGVNFSVFSRNATAVELLLFDPHDDVQPIQTIALDPHDNRTFFFWHVYVKGLKAGAHYAYRVDGPEDLRGEGFRFNRNKVLVDPYSLGNTKTHFNRDDAVGPADNLATSMRSVVIDMHDYDWEGDQLLRLPMKDLIIYEMHVGGFTRHPSSGVKHPGTFAGVIEKIPYLKELGITAVELLPVMQYDSKEVLRMAPDGAGPLRNYWGYSTINFFAPEDSYCVNPEEGEHLHNFRNMVKALHRANIAVILDVVFNHTNEGNHLGPTYNFKGFANEVYYHLVERDRQYYMDYSGCGNTVNCNHPIVEKFIVECLEYWVREMHVDGFRFDEGSILARGQDGAPLAYPPVVWSIELSGTLHDTKIIAEAWDAAGLYPGQTHQAFSKFGSARRISSR